MSIYVEYDDGKLITIDMTVEATVKDILAEVRKDITYPLISYQGEDITKSQELLADLGICNESKLHAKSDDRILMYGRSMFSGIPEIAIIIDFGNNKIYTVYVTSGYSVYEYDMNRVSEDSVQYRKYKSQHLYLKKEEKELKCTANILIYKLCDNVSVKYDEVLSIADIINHPRKIKML